MKTERAIEILNPEHREHYDNIETVNEACRMGMEALKRSRWIPVEEENPPEGELILCSDGNVVFQGMLAAGVWVLDNVARGLQPTHWMLLPEPPTAEWQLTRNRVEIDTVKLAEIDQFRKETNEYPR